MGQLETSEARSAPGIPLLIGLTGYTQIAPSDEPKLSSAFGVLLDQLVFAHKGLPLAVMSALCPGAEIIAAERAFAARVPVIALLPAPQADYEQRFSPDHLARFRAALQQSSTTIVVGTSENPSQSDNAVALCLATFSHIAAIFWDGATLDGGAGETSLRCEKRARPPALMPTSPPVTARYRADV